MAKPRTTSMQRFSRSGSITISPPGAGGPTLVDTVTAGPCPERPGPIPSDGAPSQARSPYPNVPNVYPLEPWLMSRSVTEQGHAGREAVDEAAGADRPDLAGTEHAGRRVAGHHPV